MALPSGAGDLYRGFHRKQSLLTFVDLQCHDHISHRGSRPVPSQAQLSTQGLFCKTRTNSLICINKIHGQAYSEPGQDNSISKNSACFSESPTRSSGFAATGAIGVGPVAVHRLYMCSLQIHGL